MQPQNIVPEIEPCVAAFENIDRARHRAEMDSFPGTSAPSVGQIRGQCIAEHGPRL